MYKLLPDTIFEKSIYIQRMLDGAFIPMVDANSDYQQFKKDLQSGATLQDADGNTMTADQITTFLGTLK
jgi:hypothetical protein